MTVSKHDIIIIGGGAAGLAAGLYASRGRMDTVLIERMGCGGQAVIADWIENYPGFPDGISGFELAQKIEEQAKKFGLRVAMEDVTGIVPSPDSPAEKIVRTAENEYRAPAIIIASGARHKTLQIPGESEFHGKGVSYCATCDGPFFRDKQVVVVGGGNSAVQEAIFLTRFARNVTLIHRRDRLRATAILQERAKSNPKINFIWNSVVTNIFGKETLEGITIKDVVQGKETSLPTQGVFVFVGLQPFTDFARGHITLDEYGYVVTDGDMNTSVPGIFACGDVRKKLLRQVVTAVGEGALAAFAAQEYIEDLRGIRYK